MKKLDFFLAALRHGAYRKTDWAFRCFTQIIDETSGDEFPYIDYPYQPVIHAGLYKFMDEKGDIHGIEDCDPTLGPIAKFTDRAKLKPGDMPNVKEAIDTPYGNMFLNQYCLVYAFGDRIPFQTGKWNPKKIEAVVEEHLVDNPEGRAAVPANKVTVSEYLRFTEAAYSLEGFSGIAIPSATAKSMRIPPEIIKRRDELIEKNRGKLSDPAVAARIEAELVKMLKEYLKDDPSMGFFIKEKYFTDVLKKTRIMFGLESGLDAKDAEFIVNSLQEGWDYDKMPAMINSLRMGSINRGKLTELGGVAAKEAFRALMNQKISGPDCGTKLYLPKVLRDSFADQYVGMFHMVGGRPVEITKENVAGLVGRKIQLRFPMLCESPDNSYCEVCMGKQLSNNASGLSTIGAEVGNDFMYVFMKKMHVTSVSNARYDFMSSIFKETVDV